MGNDTDTMTRSLKSVLQLAFALLVMAGLSAGPAMGQTFIDPSTSGGGGSGTFVDPYRAGDFQAALDAAAGGELVFLSDGTLSAPSGSASTYSTASSPTFTADTTNGTINKRAVTLDQPLEVSDDASTDASQTLTLQAVDVRTGGNAFILGDQESVETDDVKSSGNPGAIIYTGDAQLQALKDGGNKNSIDRLVVESGSEATLFSQVNQDALPELEVTDSLVVAGTMDLGANDLAFKGESSAPPNELDVEGTILSENNNGRFLFDLSGLSGTYETEGTGAIDALFRVTGTSPDSTVITFSELGPTRLGTVAAGSPYVDGSGPGEINFLNATTIETELDVAEVDGTAGTDEVFFPSLTSIASTLRIGDADAGVNFGSDDLEVDGNTELAAGTASFSGVSTFTDTVEVAGNGAFDATFSNLTTFEEELILASGGGSANLTFAAPGLAGFGARNDYDLNNFEDAGISTAASTVQGEFVQNGVGTIALSDGSGNDNGIHNLQFADDLRLDAPNNLTINTPDGSRVVFSGLSQEIDFRGDGTLSVPNIDVLSSDAVNGQVEIQRNGDPDRTLDVNANLRLLGGDLDTQGALDARGATLVRRIADGAEGIITGGGASDFAYTDNGDVSNGGGGIDLPDAIVYIGGEEPGLEAADGTTGPELPDLSADDEQAIDLLVTRSPATITIDASNGRGSSEYEVGRIAARAGTFALDTDVAVENDGTVERLNGVIAENGGELVYPSVNVVGSDGVNLLYSATPETPSAQFDGDTPPEGSVFPYENEEITTGAEFPADSDAILDVIVEGTDTGLSTQDRGAASVLLAETEDFYRFNQNAQVQRGAALGFNEQTLEMNTVEGESNQFIVVNDGTVASADGSTLRFTGRGLAGVFGNVQGSSSDFESPKVFTFPAIAINKPDDDSDDDSEARRVRFQVFDAAADEADGFEFDGDFTIANAQTWSPSGIGVDDALQRDGVEFLSGGSEAGDVNVDVVRVTGNFTQSSGSVLAFGSHEGSEFTVEGNFTKDAAESSRFYAGGNGGYGSPTGGSVGAFTVEGNLVQANGTFYAIVNNSFDVGGDVVNNSPDKWTDASVSTSFSFESEAFEVDGAEDAVATVSGSVTQDTTGNPVFDDESTDPIENEGIFLVEGFTGQDGEVSVGDSFTNVQGDSRIPDATTVSVANTVAVESDSMSVNLGSDANSISADVTGGQQVFSAGSLTVAAADGNGSGSPSAKTFHDPDAVFEASTDSEVQNPLGPDSELPNPEPGAFAESDTTDYIDIGGATNVQGQLALEGFELKQGGDFTLEGTGDRPWEPGLDTSYAESESGLLGLVRFDGDGDAPQTVTTDESPSTYFHGFAVSAPGDVELASNVTLNRAAGGQGIIGSPEDDTPESGTVGGTVRPFGTLFLESGNLITGEDNQITVLEPEPTDGGDLIEAVSADETRDGNPAEASPVLGGSNATKVLGTMRRALSEQNADTGGQVEDGYIFPLGGTERPEYRALVLELPSDESEPEFFTVTSGENPNEPLPDGLTSVDAFDENGTIDLDVQSLPYFRVESDENPDFSAFNMRVISALKPGTVSEVRQLRLIQRDGDWQEAGIYDRDAGSNIDDDAGQTGGPNADISGFRNVIHEGVNIEDGNIIAVASDRSINPLAQDQAIALSGTVAYPTVDNGSLTSGRELEGVEVEASSSDTTATTTTDSNGSFALAGLPAGDYTVAITDVGAEVDNVSTGDALRAVRGFAGIDAFAGSFQEQVADVNDSGNVNATDALLIAQFVLGNVDGFDSGAFVTESESVTVEGGSETSVGLFAAEAGDVRLNGGETGSSQSALASSTVSPKTSGGAVAVQSSGATSSAGAESGETFEVPVRIDRSTTVGAYQMTFDFPSEKASFEGIKGAGQDVLTSASDGTVKVSWFDQSGKSALDLREGSELVTLRFKAADNAEGVEFAPEVTSGEIAAADATPVSAGVEVQAVNISTPTPDQFALNGSYPNPVQGQATIDMDLPSRADVTVEVYNVLGQRVQTMERTMSAGAGQTIKLDGSKLASGQYFYRVKANSEDKTVQESGRITVVK